MSALGLTDPKMDSTCINFVRYDQKTFYAAVVLMTMYSMDLSEMQRKVCT